MKDYVSSREANQRFSEILRRAAAGETVTITRRGEPVAQVVPLGEPLRKKTATAAHGRLIRRLKKGLSLGGRSIDRDSLYRR